jgi:hypothetical protein
VTEIDLSGYTVTDNFFGEPFIDEDAEWDAPAPHRTIHGGFSDTDTRFRFHFPPKDSGYAGRMFNPLSGANGGTEDFFHVPFGEMIGGVGACFRLGGYAVQSNQGHIGDVLDPKAGEDPTVYGWRASAESARLSKFVAKQIYGEPPHHSYVFGGSGGARRSPLCLAYAPDAWDAAMPFMGDAMDGDHGDFTRTRQGAGRFATMFNVQRLLGSKVKDVIDANWPGGNQDPFDGLDSHTRDEFAWLYRLGYPRGDEFMLTKPMGQMWLWASTSERFQRDDPYFAAFWTEPGHLGHDQPELFARDLLDATATVSRVLTAGELAADPSLAGPEYEDLRTLATIMALATGQGLDLPCAIEVSGLGGGYRLGCDVRIVSGKAAGRQLVCLVPAGNWFFCDGMGEASNLRFTDVLAGDEVRIDNHAFLAYCYYARHHLRDSQEYDILRPGGRPIHIQYEQPEMSPFMGTPHTGKFPGKMLWVHHTHDASLWPSDGVGMLRNVEREVGHEEGRKHFRLRFTQNAEHTPPSTLPTAYGRAPNTWVIDYLGPVEQSLADLVQWVESGIEPSETHFELVDGQIVLPPTAKERGGIQPVVSVTANGAGRTEVEVGAAVSLRMTAELPDGAGTIISAQWDFDGSGTYPERATVDGSATSVECSTSHAFDRPGTYFVTALVESNREGDVTAVARRIPNLASARVVVR